MSKSKQVTVFMRGFGKSARRGIGIAFAAMLILIAGWFAATLLLGIGGQSKNAGKPSAQDAEGANAKTAAASEEDSLPPVAKTLVSEKDGADMIFIPPGEFSMGTDGGYANEKPEHIVSVDGFYLYKYEVT